MSSFKYEKPEARTLGALSAAEGFCFTGSTASGSTCSGGPNDLSTCGTGGNAAHTTNNLICQVGNDAGNCQNGTIAGGPAV